jgi:hypothetical protein
VIHRRPTLLAAIGFAAAAAAAGLALSLDHDDSVDAPVVALAPLAEPPLDQDRSLPAIDIVRIGEHGNAMIAGRAVPRAEVQVLDTATDPARSLGRAVADSRGEWVFVPDLPLTAGAWQVVPHSLAADGGLVAAGVPVVIVMPELSQATSPQALAVALPVGGGGRVLLAPSGLVAPSGPVAIDVVEREENGEMVAAGHAAPGAVVHFYMDNRLASRARAGESGRWRATARAPSPGEHALRADQVDSRGKVVDRVEQPWQETAEKLGGSSELEVRTNAGSWRIIRPGANAGTTICTVVYQADRARTRDPDLLYPGQVVSAP